MKFLKTLRWNMLCKCCNIRCLRLHSVKHPTDNSAKFSRDINQ
jgi:hypothetical protein